MTQINRTSPSKVAEVEIVFNQLLIDYYPSIHRLALSILDDRNDADDMTQETFISAYYSLPEFRSESNLKTWLYSIALNACRGRLRKRKVQYGLVNTLQSLHLLNSPPSFPEQAVVQHESEQNLWRAVDELGEKHRLPVILLYVHELQVSEIAEILNLSQGTVYSRLHYARRKLHAQLGHLNPHAEVPDDTSI